MKKVLYSSYTKFAAVVLFAVCIAFCANILADVAVWADSEDVIYSYESSFDESDWCVPILATPERCVFEAYEEFYRIRTYRTTLDECVSSKLAYLNDSNQINYFVEINGQVFTNCGATAKEQLTDDRFFILSQRDALGTHYDSSLDNNYMFYLDSIYELNKTDAVTVCASIQGAYADECEMVWSEQEAYVKRSFSGAIACAAAALIAFIYLVAVCGKSQNGEHKLMWVDYIFTDLHLAVVVLSIIGVFYVWLYAFGMYFNEDFPQYLLKPAVIAASVLAGLLALNSVLSIVRRIKCREFIKGSFICRFVSWVWRGFVRIIRALAAVFSKKTSVLLVTMLLVYTAIIGLCGIFMWRSPMPLVAAVLLFLLAAVVVSYRAVDVEKIRQGAGQVRNGNLSYKIPDVKCEDLKNLADDINEIAAGLDRSVAAKLKAERLKTELITNVSHDLKTPLTSIISYTELLSNVDGLPDEAKDYIQIIAKKSDRLKTLTQDLFDISKVQSGNDDVVFERLDISLLVNQSLGEHDAEIKESGLTFCVDVEKDLFITADGRKMSRVVSNLISNILKYTMKNTRVFISAGAAGDEVVIEFKNIASYPMEFDADEIMGRFVRGDESRTTDGSGLGLAIAKSYTEVCGGTFYIVTDGDLFKAVIRFRKA